MPTRKVHYTFGEICIVFVVCFMQCIIIHNAHNRDPLSGTMIPLFFTPEHSVKVLTEVHIHQKK